MFQQPFYFGGESETMATFSLYYLRFRNCKPALCNHVFCNDCTHDIMTLPTVTLIFLSDTSLMGYSLDLVFNALPCSALCLYDDWL